MGYVGGSLAEFVDTYDIDEVSYRIALRVGRQLKDLVERFTPVAEPDPRDDRGGRAPGTLKRSWELEPPVRTASGNWIVRVKTDDPVAPHVEYPTRPHIIRPKRARRLRFFADGQMIFAMEVHHPGTKGAFMMARALAALSAEWRVIARRELGARSASVSL